MRSLILLFSSLLLLPLTAQADEVHLKNGGRLTGVVVEQDEHRVVLETGPGRVAISRDRVARVVTSTSALQLYRDRAARLRADDATGWVELGRWAEDNGLLTQAADAYDHALRHDPSNVAAHVGLGHVNVGGVWMSEDESFRARGYVRFEGQWVRPEERDARVAERMAAAAESQARAEADARRREAEARARAAEADARAAEANARLHEEPAEEGIPFYPPYGGYGGVYGGGVVVAPPPPPPPVVVVVKPHPRPSTPPAQPAPRPMKGARAGLAEKR